MSKRPFVIGVCGFAGVGKTTAIDFLRSHCGGHTIYVGQVVIDEVRRRQLELTPENEKAVRLDLRKDDPAALIALKRSSLENSLNQGDPVLIDAVMLMEEFHFIRAHSGNAPVFLLQITADLETRVRRLNDRKLRTLTREQAQARDVTELEKLNIGDVFKNSDRTIANDGTQEDFEGELNTYLRYISASCLS